MLRRKLGPFGVKDVFTMVNLFSGVLALGFVGNGEVRNAGYAVVVGFLLGDLLDGPVARLTQTANRFGAELDAVTDHFVHVFVPAVVIYTVYERGHHAAEGLAAVAALLVAATVRHARLAAARFNYPLCWCGLPRTITGFAALSFPLSTLFAATGDRYVVGLLVVAVLSVLNLVPIPYMTHRGRRAMQPWVKVLVGAFFLSAPVTFLIARRFTFDAFFVGTMGYAIGGWVPVHPEERRAFYAEYRRWAAELAS